MKPALIILSALLLGLLLGLGITAGRMAVEPWDGDPVSGSLHVELGGGKPPDSGEPKVAVDKTVYDFGTMKFEDQGKHDFVFRNEGDGPLVLTQGRRSCQCTRSNIALAEVPPGGSTKVTLEWRPKGPAEQFAPDGKGEEYKQSATINTNDQKWPEVELTVKGRIMPPLAAVPSEVGIGWMSGEETVARDVKLLCYLSTPLELAALRQPQSFKLADQDTARFFDVSFEPLPADDLRKAGASSGVSMRVTVKPGLPQGPFQQTILLATKLDDAPSMVVTVKGEVGREIEIRGPRPVWDSKRNLLTLGAVDPETGAEQRLAVAVRGPHRDEVRPTVAKVEPKCFQVEVGKAETIGAHAATGGTATIPLIVRVPPGAAAVTRLGPGKGGYGQIEIDTHHPRIPTLRIAVAFEVAEK